MNPIVHEIYAQCAGCDRRVHLEPGQAQPPDWLILTDHDNATLFCSRSCLADSRSHRHACGLTTHEIDVLELVAQGMSNHEIGTVLSFTERTIKNVMTGAMRKLDAHTRLGAVLSAHAHGVLDLDASATRYVERTEDPAAALHANHAL